jgi:hypothetical protein
MAYTLGESSTCYDFPIQREDVEGIIMLSCEKIPEMFAAVKSEASVRMAIDTCLKNALGINTLVFIDICIDKSIINTVVKFD